MCSEPTCYPNELQPSFFSLRKYIYMKLPESSFILLQLAGPFQNLSLVQLFVKLYTRKYRQLLDVVMV